MKRIIFLIISYIIPVALFAQTQYDYYDESAVYGGTRRVLIGWIVILSLIGAFLVFALIGWFFTKITYWFNPDSNPDVIERKRKELEQQKNEEISRQKEVEIERKRNAAVPDAIDLGLSVKWASFNLGAYKPGDLGNKYEWSKTEPTNTPSWGRESVNTHSLGIISGNRKKDAATNKLGEGWRIPKSEECRELISKCIWTESEQDGVSGKLITGPNGNTIFIPYIPFEYETIKTGEYWTANPHIDIYQESAEVLLFNNKGVLNGKISRSLSSSLHHIRPVFTDATSQKKNKETNNLDIVKIKKTQIIDEELFAYYEKQCETSEYIHPLSGIIFDPDKTILDENGAIYSNDEKKLLECKDYDKETFYVKEGVEYICNHAFSYSSSISVVNGCVIREDKEAILKKIVLPSSIIYVSYWSIPDNCKIESHSPFYIVVDDLLIDTRRNCVVKCLNKFIDNITVLNNVLSIGDKAFEDCKALKEIIFPNTLISIGDSAFKDCVSLNKIVLPSSIKSVGSQAFWGCKDSIIEHFPTNLTDIGNYAFYDSIIDGAVIPNSIKTLGDCPFSRNNDFIESVSNIYIVDGCFLVNSDTKELIQLIYDVNNDINIPEYIERIGNRAFAKTTIISISLHGNIKEIGHGICQECEKLKQISIGNGIKIISRNAFGWCESLEKIELPSSIEDIQDNAFYGCGHLQTVVFNEGLKRIGRSSFCNCKSLQSISFPGSLEIIGCESFDRCSKLSSIDLNNGLKIIDSYAFNNCNINSIQIPKTVEQVGALVSSSSNSISNIYYDAKNASVWGFPDDLLNIYIGEHVEVLPENLIRKNNRTKDGYLEKLIIPKNVRVIKKNCISGCGNYIRIKILSKTIEFEKGWLHDCPYLERIYVPVKIFDKVYQSLDEKDRIKIKKVFFFTIFRG